MLRIFAALLAIKPAAINGNNIAIQQFDVPAQGNKLLTDLTDGWTIILPEVGNCLEARLQPACQPDRAKCNSWLRGFAFTAKPRTKQTPVAREKIETYARLAATAIGKPARSTLDFLISVEKILCHQGARPRIDTPFLFRRKFFELIFFILLRSVIVPRIQAATVAR
jgi:hypothetical protein